MEPPELAIGALARNLRTILSTSSQRSAWPLVFADLVDKAKLAEPRPDLLYVLHAAVASAPTAAEGKAARNELRQFSAELRDRLKSGVALPRHNRDGLEVLIVVPKKIEREALDA